MSTKAEKIQISQNMRLAARVPLKTSIITKKTNAQKLMAAFNKKGEIK